MNGWMDVWMVRWTDVSMDGWMGDGVVDRWMGDALVDGWMFGWMNG
jgi:hypothetical protein